ncbi:unnamed protein product, partial [Dracunculus medinensis]|uniref:TMEM127 domain-containing protein n=1 Tax=Dracunculus medinensis TaxID=318479 RepID=A0A0N4U3F6_DRAME
DFIRVGTRDFWRTSRFGSFVDTEGTYHIAFHSNGRVFIDCITPLLANYFYLLIAFCFVIFVKSFLACVLHITAPENGFLHWLQRNAILELSVSALLACATLLIAENELIAIRPNSSISMGPGLIFIALLGLCSFSSALISFHRNNRLARERRLFNARLICGRSLRSWRDNVDRTDLRLIIDFERYLNSPDI